MVCGDATADIAKEFAEKILKKVIMASRGGL